MIRKLRAIGIFSRPVPIFAGIATTGFLGFLLKLQKNRIKKSTKISLEEKINFGITDDKLKIIIPEIDFDFGNNQEKIIASVSEIKKTIEFWKKITRIDVIEVIGILPESKKEKISQIQMLDFVQKLSSALEVKYKIIEKQFYYDIEPNISDNDLETKIQKELKTEIGLSCVVYISKIGEIYFRQ